MFFKEMQQKQVDKAPERCGCEAEVNDPERQHLLWLMEECFRTLNYDSIKSRLPGAQHVPPVLEGSVASYRPDLVCKQTDPACTPLILEVVTKADLENPASRDRWDLLASATANYEAELHLVARSWQNGENIAEKAKRVFAALDIPVHRIWAV